MRLDKATVTASPRGHTARQPVHRRADSAHGVVLLAKLWTAAAAMTLIAAAAWRPLRQASGG